MPRPEGRRADELRKITIKYEGLDRVDGSARFGFGDTQALVSVSGPIEVRPNSELPSQATLEVHIRPLASMPGTDSKALAATLKSILTPVLLLSQHPRTLVQIVVQALCSSDIPGKRGSGTRGWHASLVAGVINASSAARINASSVPMKGVVCAVAVGRSSGSPSHQPTLLLDPSEAEILSLTGGGCFIFMFSSTFSSTPGSAIPPCSLLWTDYAASSGSFDEVELENARKMAEVGATHIWHELKHSLEGKGQPTVAQTSKAKPVTVPSEGSVDDEKMEIS